MLHVAYIATIIMLDINLKACADTDFNEMSSGRQMGQSVKVLRPYSN